MIPPRRLLYNIAATISGFIFVLLLIGWLLSWHGHTSIATIWERQGRGYFLDHHHGYIELVPYTRESPRIMRHETVHLRVPSYLIVPLFLILPFRWMKQKRQRWIWFTSGRCPICGYDLRATHDLCPECGNIPRDPR